MNAITHRFLLAGLVIGMFFGSSLSCCPDNGGDDDAGDDDTDVNDDTDEEGDGPCPDDDDDDYDDDDCANNVAPELLGAYYVVNGEFADPPIMVTPDDLFGVYFEYNDDDCNIPGGHFYLNLNDGGYEAFDEPLPEELGCSTAESGLVYGFSMENPQDVGEYTFAVNWTDLCGAQSNALTGGWTVAE